MRPYVIRQGDYLTKLAHTMGFDPDTIWNHAKNEQIRKKRPNKDLLHPGDILWVPDEAEHRRLLIRAGSDNRYVARVPGVYVAVKVTIGGEPLVKEPFRILGLGEPIEGETDDKGYIRAGVPVHVREIEVYLPSLDRTLRLRVGDLDPVDTVSGIKKRLMHLGYYQPTRVGVENAAADGDALVSALKTFQSDRGLTPNGKLDESTAKALTGDHGS
ncbi:MAG: peptidoglycan-binding protein [Myxococcales bacterium]|nr:peptidoglycan-binding protein [Myxococcales bacterium]